MNVACDMKNESIFRPPIQKVCLNSIDVGGLILDVGGGGEGLVARIGGDKVCAVDINLDKIREARIHKESANWFNCDGRNLCFKSKVFDMATLWFALGYMRTWQMKESVLREVYRVLKDEALLSIWACRVDCEEAAAIIRTDISFPNGTTSRFGFGLVGQQDQTLETVSMLLESVGFTVERILNQDYVFYVSCKKEGTR